MKIPNIMVAYTIEKTLIMKVSSYLPFFSVFFVALVLCVV